MSKSIYGDALAIIDNIYESDTVADFDYYDVRGLPLSWEVDRDELEKIKHALEQAQKQEKLLGLYKEYFEYSEMLKDGRKFGGRMLVEHERDKLSEEIKELEK